VPTALVTPLATAIALKVVDAAMVIALEYTEEEVVGVLPSVV
jgi:hypothetical protein